MRLQDGWRSASGDHRPNLVAFTAGSEGADLLGDQMKPFADLRGDPAHRVSVRGSRSPNCLHLGTKSAILSPSATA